MGLCKLRENRGVPGVNVGEPELLGWGWEWRWAEDPENPEDPENLARKKRDKQRGSSPPFLRLGKKDLGKEAMKGKTGWIGKNS